MRDKKFTIVVPRKVLSGKELLGYPPPLSRPLFFFSLHLRNLLSFSSLLLLSRLFLLFHASTYLPAPTIIFWSFNHHHGNGHILPHVSHAACLLQHEVSPLQKREIFKLPGGVHKGVYRYIWILYLTKINFYDIIIYIISKNNYIKKKSNIHLKVYTMFTRQQDQKEKEEQKITFLLTSQLINEIENGPRCITYMHHHPIRKHVQKKP